MLKITLIHRNKTFIPAILKCFRTCSYIPCSLFWTTACHSWHLSMPPVWSHKILEAVPSKDEIKRFVARKISWHCVLQYVLKGLQVEWVVYFFAIWIRSCKAIAKMHASTHLLKKLYYLFWSWDEIQYGIDRLFRMISSYCTLKEVYKITINNKKHTHDGITYGKK